MIPEALKKYIDELIKQGLEEMDGATSTTASAGGEYTGKYFLKKPGKLEEKTPTLAAGKANISSYTKDGFTPAKEGMPSDSKIYDYKQFPSTPKPKRFKLYKEIKIQPASSIHDLTNPNTKIDNIKVNDIIKYKDEEYIVTDIKKNPLDRRTAFLYKTIKDPRFKDPSSVKINRVYDYELQRYIDNAKSINQEQINEISYRRFNEKVSKVTTERKIVRALQEVSKRIREIEQVIEYSNRLKTENVVKNESFWVSKTNQLSALSERLNELSNKIRNLSQ